MCGPNEERNKSPPPSVRRPPVRAQVIGQAAIAALRERLTNGIRRRVREMREDLFRQQQRGEPVDDFTFERLQRHEELLRILETPQLGRS